MLDYLYTISGLRLFWRLCAALPSYILQRYRRMSNTLYFKIMFCFVFMCQAVQAGAEEIKQQTVRGTVLDESDIPIRGTTVMVRRTGEQSVSDNEGKFSVPALGSDTLVVTYMGYLPQEIVIADRETVTVRLVSETQELEEVVAIGYGTTTRKDFTGSVTSIRLENSPVALAPNLNALESLKGNVPGLDIGAANSAGGQPSMLLRGQNSISGNNDPLIVVDGVIFMGNIGDINPNDIESFDILKDATSAAAYGSRSSNGVIMITTKKGKTGKPVLSLNTSGGIQQWHLQPKLMGGAQWLDMVRDKNRYNDYSFLSNQQRENYEAGNEIDWLDESTRQGSFQDHQLAVSGAGEKMNYYLSSGFAKNKGIVMGDKFQRVALLGKIQTEVTSWLNIGVDAAYTHSDYSGRAANLNGAALLTPYDMKYRGGSDSLLEKYPTGQNEFVSPLWGVESDNLVDEDIRNNFRLNTHALIEVPWVEGLSYRINYTTNLDIRNSGEFYHPSFYAPQGPYDDESRYSLETQQNYLATANGLSRTEKTGSWVMDHILTYKKNIGEHALDLTAVATRDSWNYRDERFTGRDFSANGNSILGLDGLHYAGTQRLHQDDILRRNIGYLLRASYAFAGKYHFTSSYRRDGASVFGMDRKWGDFYALGAAWQLSEEPFMQQLSFLDAFKLKFSWGRNGNQGVSPYGTLSRVDSGPTGGIVYAFGNNGIPYYGIRQAGLGNRTLGWESTDAWNTGFESSWLDHRLDVNLDVYFSSTTDQIFTRTIPVMSGFPSMLSSMGEVRNRGLELFVRSQNIRRTDFSWETGVTFWLNRNRLKHLYGDDLNNDGKEDDDIGNSLFIGHSIHAIYGYKQIGIVQMEDEEYMRLNGVQAGTPMYQDIDGDGVITIADRSVIANRDPRFKLNLSNTVTWKDFQLYFLISGTFGGNGYYQAPNKPAFMAGSGGGGFASNNMYVPYWSAENPSDRYPAAWFLGDDFFLGLQDRTYVRLQDVNIAYNFPTETINRLGVQRIKLFLSGKNMWTSTKWAGGDPELGNTIVDGTWPVARTITLGANLTF